MNLDNMTWDEKYELAWDPSTPEDILRELATDPSAEIRWHVAMNKKASGNLLVALFEYEKSLKSPCPEVILYLYGNANCPAFIRSVIDTIFREILING